MSLCTNFRFTESAFLTPLAVTVITLTLLHPSQATPLQHWQFDDQSVIRIGRAVDNNVVLYSAVVSRRHLEIRRSGDDWEVENLGANGTFLQGKPITKTAVVDGMVVRLATSGPQIQIRLIDEDNQPKLIIKSLENTLLDDQTSQEKDTMAN